MNDYKEEKVLIRASRSKAGVFKVLEQEGVDVSQPLSRAMSNYRSSYQYQKMELLRVAIARLSQIENSEV